MTNDTIILTDSIGYAAEFTLIDLYEQLKANDFKLFGMNMEAMLYMLRQYRVYNGPDPITKQSIEDTFRNLQKVPEQDWFENWAKERQRTKRLLPCPFHRPLTNPSAVNT